MCLPPFQQGIQATTMLVITSMPCWNEILKVILLSKNYCPYSTHYFSKVRDKLRKDIPGYENGFGFLISRRSPCDALRSFNEGGRMIHTRQTIIIRVGTGSRCGCSFPVLSPSLSFLHLPAVGHRPAPSDWEIARWYSGSDVDNKSRSNASMMCVLTLISLPVLSPDYLYQASVHLHLQRTMLKSDSPDYPHREGAEGEHFC